MVDSNLKEVSGHVMPKSIKRIVVMLYCNSSPMNSVDRKYCYRYSIVLVQFILALKMSKTSLY